MPRTTDEILAEMKTTLARQKAAELTWKNHQEKANAADSELQEAATKRRELLTELVETLGGSPA